MSAQYFQFALASYSFGDEPARGDDALVRVGLDAGLSAAAGPGRSTSVVVGEEQHVGDRLLHLLTNCFAEPRSPERNTVSTCSVFHLSMKLSSCACAAVVSPRGADVEDRGRARASRRPSSARARSCRSRRSPRWCRRAPRPSCPSSVLSFFSSWIRIDADRSGMLPGVTMSPAATCR